MAKYPWGVVRTTYLIDEDGVIVKAMDKVKAAENPQQMLESAVMRIILSPAKKMNVNTDDLAPCGLPAFMEQTEEDRPLPAGTCLTGRQRSCGHAMTGSQNRITTGFSKWICTIS